MRIKKFPFIFLSAGRSWEGIGFVSTDRVLGAYKVENSSYRDGYAAGCQIAQMAKRPTAVFCLDDIVAIGMLKAFQEKGIKVPNDIALVGFDNTEASAYAAVPLTTVAQPISEIATESVRMLFDRIDSPDLPVKQIYLEPKLIIRESCGAHLKDQCGFKFPQALSGQ